MADKRFDDSLREFIAEIGELDIPALVGYTAGVYMRTSFAGRKRRSLPAVSAASSNITAPPIQVAASDR